MTRNPKIWFIGQEPALERSKIRIKHVFPEVRIPFWGGTTIPKLFKFFNGEVLWITIYFCREAKRTVETLQENKHGYEHLVSETIEKVINMLTSWTRPGNSSFGAGIIFILKSLNHSIILKGPVPLNTITAKLSCTLQINMMLQPNNKFRAIISNAMICFPPRHLGLTLYLHFWIENDSNLDDANHQNVPW